MPPQKRPSPETVDDGDEEGSLQQNFRRRHCRRPPRLPSIPQPLGHDGDDDEDSEGIDPADLPEVPISSDYEVTHFDQRFISVDLEAVREDVQCGICLGILKKTLTVMGCMHRFCTECIEKALRAGKKECPTCRLHCPSRRSLREDDNYDKLISILFPDIDKYEKEEISLLEEEKTRNKQTEESFAQISKRQSVALNKRDRKGKDKTEEASIPRLPLNNGRASMRRGRNNTNARDQHWENQDEKDDENVQEFPFDNEHGTGNNLRKSLQGRRGHSRSLAVANIDNGDGKNEIRGTELLSWGSVGARTHGRHSSGSDRNTTGNARLNRLVNYLQKLQVNDNKLEVHLRLISLDNRRTNNSQKMHLCCDSRLSVKNLCDHVANETSLEGKDIEVLLVKKPTEQSTIDMSASMNKFSYLLQVVGQAEVDLIALNGQETLAELQAKGTSANGDLILAYRRKDAS